MGKVKTGNPTAYTEADCADLSDMVDEAWDDYGDLDDDDGPAAPTTVHVEAEIEWAGTYNPQSYRSTRLDGLDLTKVRAAAKRARQAVQKARQARPSASHNAQGWHARIAALTASQRGYAAADQAGLSVTARTLHGWLSGEVTPSKANRAKIDAAYQSLREWPVRSARAEAALARRAVADALTDAIRERYGAEVRLFNPGRIEFER